jgi:hypothetical protein
MPLLSGVCLEGLKIHGINAVRIADAPTQSRTRHSLFRKRPINSMIFNVKIQKVKYSPEKIAFEYKNSPHGSKSLVGQGLLIAKASRSRSDTPHTVGLLWTGDQPDTDSCT